MAKGKVVRLDNPITLQLQVVLEKLKDIREYLIFVDRKFDESIYPIGFDDFDLSGYVNGKNTSILDNLAEINEFIKDLEKIDISSYKGTSDNGLVEFEDGSFEKGEFRDKNETTKLIHVKICAKVSKDEKTCGTDTECEAVFK